MGRDHGYGTAPELDAPVPWFFVITIVVFPGVRHDREHRLESLSPWGRGLNDGYREARSIGAGQRGSAEKEWPGALAFAKIS